MHLALSQDAQAAAVVAHGPRKTQVDTPVRFGPAKAPAAVMFRAGCARVVLPRGKVRCSIGVDKELKMVPVIVDAEEMVRECVVAWHGLSGLPPAAAAGVGSALLPIRSGVW